MEKDGHKMIIKQSEGGRWYYWSRKDPDDKGTILDFVGRRMPGGEKGNFDLRAVIGQLRAKLAGGSELVHRREPERKLRVSAFDRNKALSAYQETQISATCGYLMTSRCLSQETLGSARFRGTWRVDRFGTAVFPHHDDDGLCGFERRGRTVRGFSSGGRKAAWLSNVLPGDRFLFLTEQSIDAMSHNQIVRRPGIVYGSIAGEPSLWQWEYLKELLRSRSHLQIIAGFDADSEGERFTARLRDLAGREVLRERPEWRLASPAPPDKKLDWNFLLQNGHGRSMERALAL
jgi:hypothetical protein